LDLNHLHIHVRDVGKAKDFYEKYFGFKEHVWHGEILFMRNVNDFDLALMPDQSEWSFPEWFHFGFRLNSAEEVRSLYQRLKTTDVKIISDLEDEGDFIFFRCLDPDKNKIEVYWE
jgi:catechol 2,3-dioxygenase-like lactoylglutathione lyase family enzyme